MVFQHGQFKTLMLGIVQEGVPFSVIWTMRDKRGNSSSDERIDLPERLYRVFPKAQSRPESWSNRRLRV